MIDFILILVLCAMAWYWWDTAYCNELALTNCRNHCNASEVQLLDGSVARRRVWLRRNENGSVQLCRLYGFEYSENHESRHNGYIVLLGRKVVETRLESQSYH